MKTVIAGSRTISDVRLISAAIDSCGWYISEVVSGGARGVDKAGEQWAAEHKMPVKIFKADWKGNGRGAGMIRNSEMVKYADAVIAIWDGVSKGTEHTITLTSKLDKPLFVVVSKHGEIPLDIL